MDTSIWDRLNEHCYNIRMFRLWVDDQAVIILWNMRFDTHTSSGYKKSLGLLATRRRLGRRGDSSAMRSAFVVWVVCYEV